MKILTYRKVNKTKKLIFLVAVMLLLVLAVLLLLFNNLLGPCDAANTDTYLVKIEPGLSTSSIAKILTKEQIISNPQVFQFYVKLNKMDRQLKAGEYELSPSMTIAEIAAKLKEGRVITEKFTIPEGYTLEQICQVLVNKGLVKEEEFWQVVKEEPFEEFEFLKGIPNDEKRLEGYLFPDTYVVSAGMSAKQIIEMMLKRFEEVYNELPPNTTDLTMREVVILASMVELEAVVDKDRPLIASTFLNRLKIGMKLGCDATVQYALPERKQRVLWSDLKIDSPYNTYIYKGLPPGPIGSPGKASLEAVHQPAKTDYLYFVARKDGSFEHVFSRTLEEHNQNKKKLGY